MFRYTNPGQGINTQTLLTNAQSRFVPLRKRLHSQQLMSAVLFWPRSDNTAELYKITSGLSTENASIQKKNLQKLKFSKTSIQR